MPRAEPISILLVLIARLISGGVGLLNRVAALGFVAPVLSRSLRGYF